MKAIPAAQAKLDVQRNPHPPESGPPPESDSAPTRRTQKSEDAAHKLALGSVQKSLRTTLRWLWIHHAWILKIHYYLNLI